MSITASCHDFPMSCAISDRRFPSYFLKAAFAKPTTIILSGEIPWQSALIPSEASFISRAMRTRFTGSRRFSSSFPFADTYAGTHDARPFEEAGYGYIVAVTS